MAMTLRFVSYNFLHGIYARKWENGFVGYKTMSENERQKQIYQNVEKWRKNGLIVFGQEVSGDQINVLNTLGMKHRIVWEPYTEVPNNTIPDCIMVDPREACAICMDASNGDFDSSDFEKVSTNGGKGMAYSEITDAIAAISVHISFKFEQREKELKFLRFFVNRKLADGKIKTIIMGGDFNCSIDTVKQIFNEEMECSVQYTSGSCVTRPDWAKDGSCTSIDHFILFGKGNFVNNDMGIPETVKKIENLSDHYPIFVTVNVS